MGLEQNIYNSKLESIIGDDHVCQINTVHSSEKVLEGGWGGSAPLNTFPLCMGKGEVSVHFKGSGQSENIWI